MILESQNPAEQVVCSHFTVVWFFRFPVACVAAKPSKEKKSLHCSHLFETSRDVKQRLSQRLHARRLPFDLCTSTALKHHFKWIHYDSFKLPTHDHGIRLVQHL